jgi:hypothetical protein
MRCPSGNFFCLVRLDGMKIFEQLKTYATIQYCKVRKYVKSWEGRQFLLNLVGALLGVGIAASILIMLNFSKIDHDVTQTKSTYSGIVIKHGSKVGNFKFVDENTDELVQVIWDGNHGVAVVLVTQIEDQQHKETLLK